MPDDGSLAQTLGGMADSWGAAYDPMARARALQIGQSLQTSQFELQKGRAIDAMAANASQVYLNANPQNQDPATLAATAAAIRNGTYNPEQWVNASVGLAKLNANRTAAAAVQPGTSETQGWSDADIASARAQLLGGASLPTFRTQQAGATTDQARSAALIAAAKAAASATPANMGDVANAAAAGAAFTNPLDALRIAAAGNLYRTGNTADPNALGDARTNTTIFAGQPPSLDTPITQANVPAVRAADIASKTAVAGAEAMARPRSAAGISSGFVADPNNPNTPVTYVQPGEATPTTPPGAVFVPPRAPSLPIVQGISAAEAAGKEGAEATAKNNNTVINEAQAGGWRAQQLDTKVQRLREVLPYLNNQNPLQQTAGALANRIQDEFGITIGPGQSARNVWETMVSQLLPELKDDYGFQRVAAPEIALAQRGLPMGNLDAPALTRIVNALDAGAQLNKRVAQIASQARSLGGIGGVTPEAYNNFIQQREALNPMDFLNQVRQANPEAPLNGSSRQPTQPTQPTAPGQPPNVSWEVLPDGTIRKVR